MDNYNPMIIFMEWLSEAKAGEPIPEACSLATCDQSNAPHVRMVLAKCLNQSSEEITFFTNLESPKSVQLTTNPRAALCFHWKSIGRQVRARGATRLASEEVSKQYFATRPRMSQITAWVANQSRTIKDDTDLKKEIELAEKKFAGKEVPKPSNWGGIVVALDEMEFWNERKGRRHLRTLFTKTKNEWNSRRLYP